MRTEIFNTYLEFLQRADKKVNGVTKEFAEQHKDWQMMNKTNAGCWCCAQCDGCVDCDCCRDCKDCEMCTKLKKSKKYFNNGL